MSMKKSVLDEIYAPLKELKADLNSTNKRCLFRGFLTKYWFRMYKPPVYALFYSNFKISQLTKQEPSYKQTFPIHRHALLPSPGHGTRLRLQALHPPHRRLPQQHPPLTDRSVSSRCRRRRSTSRHIRSSDTYYRRTGFAQRSRNLLHKQLH